MFPVYSRKCVLLKTVHNWAEKFFQGRLKVADDAWPGLPIEIATEATVQLVEKFIWADRRIMIRQCSNWTSVFPWWVPRELKDRENWTEWVCPCNISYSMQMKEKVCLTGLLLGMNNGCITTSPNQNVLQCSGNIPVYLHVQPKTFTPLAGKVMLTMFWNSQGVLLASFQKCGENVNSALDCEVLLKLRNVIRRKRPGQLAWGVLLHHDNARHLTAQTWPLVTSSVWSSKNHLGSRCFADNE
jgi:hypothetical protein